MPAKKTTTTTSASKTKSTKTRKPAKPKSETQQAQANLDDALVEKPTKTKKPVKAKTAQEELFDLVETYETGRKIGEAAVNTPALGLAIGIGAAITLWNQYQANKKEE